MDRRSRHGIRLGTHRCLMYDEWKDVHHLRHDHCDGMMYMQRANPQREQSTHEISDTIYPVAMPMLHWHFVMCDFVYFTHMTI